MNLDFMYYISTDHLGSINLIVDASNGNVVDDLSYDAWGRNRNPVDWTYSNFTLSSVTDRGYTSHEQLQNFGLINMNGRVYDPMTLGFLSPDPFVQNPSNSQNYNRYSYVLNNPLKYVDPSGYTALYPWYETTKNGFRYFKEFPEMFEDFEDSNGNFWKLREDMKFSDENGNVYLRRLDEGYYIELKNYQEYQEKLQQYNSQYGNADIGFISGAGTFRVEGERMKKNDNGLTNTNQLLCYADNYVYDGYWKSDPLKFSFNASQHVKIEIENKNLFGVQLDLEDVTSFHYEESFIGLKKKVYSGDSYSFQLFPYQSKAFDFYRHDYLPINWSFQLSTQISGVVNVQIRVYSSWKQGMNTDPNNPFINRK